MSDTKSISIYANKAQQKHKILLQNENSRKGSEMKEKIEKF